ncbi:MAG: D-sedoheptulose 7-phosphate isomerase [Sphingobacteriia bacterium]|nr:D-sedoheptulose 7-phosphate isomerase [Sphingobacteriia bacterium]
MDFNFKEIIKNEIFKTQSLIFQVMNDNNVINTVEQISLVCIDAISKGNKIIFAGNGGSAADSQHLAAEFVSKLCYDRPAMPAIAITTDTSALTAIGNDYGYEYVFSRQLDAIARPGDIFFGISTSGNSKNIIEALKLSKQRNITSIGFTGMSGGLMNDLCDYLLKIPGKETAKVQECHIMLGHIICGLIEDAIHGKEYNIQFQTANIANL